MLSIQEEEMSPLQRAGQETSAFLAPSGLLKEKSHENDLYSTARGAKVYGSLGSLERMWTFSLSLGKREVK